MGWTIHFYEEVPNYRRDGWVVLVPDFSGSLDAAWQMEEEIERRGLLGDYVAALQSHLRILGRHVIEVMETWELIHATPEQRCRAALEAVSSASQTGVREKS